MGRVISQEKLLGIAQARVDTPEALGPMLGEFVVDQGVPAEALATMLNVSNPTIYRWIFGHSAPRDKDKIAKIKKLLTVLRKARRARDLPLTGDRKERQVALRLIVEKHKPVARVS